MGIITDPECEFVRNARGDWALYVCPGEDAPVSCLLLFTGNRAALRRGNETVLLGPFAEETTGRLRSDLGQNGSVLVVEVGAEQVVRHYRTKVAWSTA